MAHFREILSILYIAKEKGQRPFLMKKFFLLFAITTCFTACKPDKPMPVLTAIPQAIAFDGRVLHQINDAPVIRKRKDSLLLIAINNFNEHPDNLENIIWYGRRLAYLTRYKEAIEVFTNGIEAFPDAPELYRHRGHRFISIREPDRAVPDLLKAAALIEGRPVEIEPDGLPNKLNQPLSSTQFNIWYHLGLAYYVQQDFSSAKAAYEECMKFSTNPDLLCATTDWLYLTYRRMGLNDRAQEILEPITEEMVLIENTSYHRRLLMYKGILDADQVFNTKNIAANRQMDLATQGYGVGCWYLVNGEEKKAIQIFSTLLETAYWPAFGYIAAEADLHYLKRKGVEMPK